MDSIGNRIGWNTLVSFLSNVGRRIIKLFGSIIFANIAGAGALGVYYVFMNLHRIGRRITALGLGQSIIFYITRAEANNKESTIASVIFSSLLIRCSVLLALTTIIFTFPNIIDEYVGLQGAWMLLILSLISTVIYTTGRASLSGFKRVDMSSSVDIFRDIVSVISQSLLAFIGIGAVGLISGYVFSIILSSILSISILYIVMRRKIGSFGQIRPSLQKSRDMMSFSKYSFLDNLVGGEQITLDILILGYFVGSTVSQSDVGVYGICYSISMLGFTLSSAVGKTVFPEISNLDEVNNMQKFEEILQNSIKYSPVLSIPLCFGAFGIGDYILGEFYSFGSGYWVLTTLTLGAIPFSIYQPIHQTFYGMDRPELAFGISFATALLNGGTNLLLIPYMGIQGAALSTLFSMTTALILGIYYVNKLDIGRTLPKCTWGLQIGSGIIMLSILSLIKTFTKVSIGHTILLLTFGIGTYTLTLIAIDREVRFRARDML